MFSFQSVISLLALTNYSSPLPLPPSPGLFPETSVSPFLVQNFAVIMIVAAPPFSLIHDIDTVNTFAELGIIMLLFVIGTEFPLEKLRSIGRISIIIALSETVGTLVISFFVAQALQLSFFDSIFLALAMSITSTVVTDRILEELKMIRDKSTTLLLAISIVEDIIAIAALGVIQSIAEQSVSGIGMGGGDELPILPITISISRNGFSKR